MLTEEENRLLTETGPGTPCGELMRRYWQPVALSEELPPGGAPLPVRLLGEDLVLYRPDASDAAGSPGLLGAHCAHRGADLSYGRVEGGRLRCIYHGWLYNGAGRCIEQPGEPEGSTLRQSIRQIAYPCQEKNGMIFAYLGPGDPPLLPNYDFLTHGEEHVFATKIYSDCNYLQGNEGNIDLLHVSFLHYSQRDLQSPDGANTPGANGTLAELSHRGSAPYNERCEGELVDVGLRVCKIRTLGPDRNYIRVGTFMLPNMYAFPAGGLNWHVPIDDTHHWKYVVSFDRDQPYDKEQLRQNRDLFTPAPKFHPIPNRSNRYLQRREDMRARSYSGIDMRYFAAQDLCATEGAGAIQDRTREHLAPNDAPLVIARKLLVSAMRDVQEGRDPPALVRDPAKNRFPSVVATFGVIPATTSWKEHCRALIDRGDAWVGRPTFTATLT
ncbi:MAG TPA: Rieske 2Fe-2S domain-containing protein [Chloroflexota bacterium]|nr:Rieske 2Fe-2S domain-containing protein [Chloroflexota bacterium]